MALSKNRPPTFYFLVWRRRSILVSFWPCKLVIYICSKIRLHCRNQHIFTSTIRSYNHCTASTTVDSIQVKPCWNFRIIVGSVKFQPYYSTAVSTNTGKNNRFPFWDILGYLKNTHKNPKFGRVRQVLMRELGWEFPGWDLSHFAKSGIFMGILKYPKITENGNLLFFPVKCTRNM